MKKTFALLLMSVALVGCRSGYDVTLSNGTRFTGVSKPRFDKKTGEYRFKTPDGRVGTFSPASIKVIEPHREAYEFKPQKSP